MKTGICTLLIAEPADPLSTAAIPYIAQAGYDYAEISMARVYNLSEDELYGYRNRFHSAGLAVEAFNNGLPAGISIVGDDVSERELDAYIQRMIYLAGFFGAGVITSSGPNARRLPQGFDWKNVGRARYVSFLKRLGAALKAAGLRFALEPICSGEQGFVNTTSQALRLIGEAGCDNISLLVDTFHFQREGEDTALLPGYVKAGVLTHLHISALPSRTVPGMSDVPALRASLVPLLDAGFDGYISIEASAQDIKRAAPEGLSAVREALKR